MFFELVAGGLRLVPFLIGALISNSVVKVRMYPDLYLRVLRFFMQSDLFRIEASESLIVHNSFIIADIEPLLGMEPERQAKTFCSISLLSSLGMFFIICQQLVEMH